MPPQTIIVQQPLSVTNTVPAEAAVFSVVAMGTPPLAYQWYFSASGATGLLRSLAGQTSPGLTLPQPANANAGSYYVVVTNSYNAVTSLVATLSLFRAPVIVQQPEPASATLFGGQSFSLSTAADAALPVYYSWTQNGIAIPAGTNAVFLFDALEVSNSGNYSVIVSNAFGVVTSKRGFVDRHPRSQLRLCPGGPGRPPVGLLAFGRVERHSDARLRGGQQWHLQPHDPGPAGL